MEGFGGKFETSDAGSTEVCCFVEIINVQVE